MGQLLTRLVDFFVFGRMGVTGARRTQDSGTQRTRDRKADLSWVGEIRMRDLSPAYTLYRPEDIARFGRQLCVSGYVSGTESDLKRPASRVLSLRYQRPWRLAREAARRSSPWFSALLGRCLSVFPITVSDSRALFRRGCWLKGRRPGEHAAGTDRLGAG